jgi:radical SAM superfamily enzyme YgiQ (UPF0313 family)
MRVLLINPFVERMHLELSYAENFRPPLGLAYCAAVLERHGHEVEIVDALVRGIRFPELRRILAERRPDIVGVSTYSPTRYECFRTAKVVKETLGEHIVVVAGGPHVSAAVEDTLENVPHIDYVVRGEGEYPLLELVRALETGGDPLAVAGVSGRRDGRPYDAPAQANVADLDGLPRPARHLLPMSRYGTRMPSTMVKSTTILTSRGCPARCTFCTRDWFSRDTRFHSPAYMADEIDEVIGRYGFRGVIIQDDTFTLNKRRVFEFCDELRSRKMRFRWLATTRVDCINLDLLKSMKDAGCEVVTFGVESMNPRILKWLKKGFTVEKVRRAIDWAREAGLKVRCTYLLGIGDETEQDIQQSIRDARALPVDKLKANVGLSLYPGTPLYPMAIEAGVLAADYSYARGYEDPQKRYGNGETPRWYTPHVSHQRILELRRETEVNVLFTRPSLRNMTHRARKLVMRLQRHPKETLHQATRLARALAGGSGLRQQSPVSPTDH